MASNDDKALAKRLIELLESPEKAREMGEKGRRAIEENFSLKAQTEKTLMLYKMHSDDFLTGKTVDVSDI